MRQLAATGVLASSAILLMVIPPMVFIATALHRGMGVAGTLSAVGEQYAADKLNLLVVSLLGLLPLILTAILIVGRKLLRKSPVGSTAYAWGGCIPVVVVAVFVNFEYWPSYLPARQFLGFPHGLEFVIGPFVFAPIGALLGFLVARMVTKPV